MPIYEYVCSACGHRTDILHGVHDVGPHFCPECGAEGTMRKAFAAPAIVFKGTGWAKKERRSASAARSGSSGKDGDDGRSGDGAGDKGGAGARDGAGAGDGPAKPASSGSGGDAGVAGSPAD